MWLPRKNAFASYSGIWLFRKPEKYKVKAEELRVRLINSLSIANRQTEALEMALKEKLKIESLPIFVFLVFYIIAAIGNLYLLAVSGVTMAHTGIIAVLSLITAYGLYKMEKWSLWLVVFLFFVGNTFGIVSLYASTVKYGFAGSTDVLLLNLALIVYIAMTWLATIYIGAKKDRLK